MSAPNVLFNVKYAQSLEAITSKKLSDKYLNERLFYSCGQADDYIKYVDKGIAAGGILEYAANPEKSSGIFDRNGFLTKKQRGQLREKLRGTKSIIWHTVISFTEAFGQKYMKSADDAMALLRAELPRFFKRIGVTEDNMTWFAGLHENTDNQHIHLAFIENSPIFTSERNNAKKRFRYGKISKDAINAFVIGAEAVLTDVGHDLKRSRGEVVIASKETLLNTQLDSYGLELKEKLLTLYRKLPLEGRVSYNSLNMADLRPQIRSIVDFIIKNNPTVKACYKRFCTDLIKRDDDVKSMCARQKISDALSYLIEDKYLDDMYRRLGDKVIQAALEIKRKEDKEKRGCKSYRAKKRVEKKNRGYLFERSAHIAKQIDDEAIRAFEEYRQKLKEAEYDKLVEEGIMEAE